MISHHSALIYTMVMVSAADQEMTDAELRKMGEIITGLPVFGEYNTQLLTTNAASCADVLDHDDGLERVLDMIEAALPPSLRETAYVLACDVAAADGEIKPEEIRMLELIRHRLHLDRLTSAAIERAARARYTKP